MRRFLAAFGFFACAFLGGAAAQVIGGSAFFALAATTWLSLIGSVSGPVTPYSCNGGTCYDVNLINVTGDNVAAGQGGNGGPTVAGFTATHSFGGGSATGNFWGATVNANLTATTGNTTGNYGGLLINAAANAAASEPNSAWWGINALSTCKWTASLQCIGSELDVALVSGAAASDKIGSQVVLTTVDRVAGSRVNIGSLLGNQDASSPGWDCGWCGGAFNGFWPFTGTSTIYGCWPRTVARNGAGRAVPDGACGTTFFVMDYRNATIAAGGAPIAMPLITPASSATACVTGSMEWDASFIYICTATNTWKRATLAAF